MIVLDTSVLWALLNRNDIGHVEARGWYERVSDELTTTPLVLAEVDYFALRAGEATTRAFYQDVRNGAFEVEWWPAAPMDAAEVADAYAGIGLGLTDASLVALAARAETTAIATFDERHFRAVKPLTGEPAFTLLPQDAG